MDFSVSYSKFVYKTLQKFPNCSTTTTPRIIGLYEHAKPRPANCDHRCQLLFTSYCQMWLISLPNGPENSYTLRHAFFGNSKQLQRHDSVHLSSIYTDYSFSSYYYHHYHHHY